MIAGLVSINIINVTILASNWHLICMLQGITVKILIKVLNLAYKIT